MCWDPLENYSACVAEFCICVARRGDLFVWRVSNTDNASVRKTAREHASNESLTKVAACVSASVSAL